MSEEAQWKPPFYVRDRRKFEEMASELQDAGFSWESWHTRWFLAEAMREIAHLQRRVHALRKRIDSQ